MLVFAHVLGSKHWEPVLEAVPVVYMCVEGRERVSTLESGTESWPGWSRKVPQRRWPCIWA
jgi:hypothetical protein